MIVIPWERGGWWHRYVCPTHGVELGHVGLLSGSFPADGAPCEYGCRWDTPVIRAAWAVLAHQACARAASVETLKEYEELYLSQPPSEEPLRGRLCYQALTDAVWAVSIGLAARRLGNPVPELLGDVTSAMRKARDAVDFRSNYVAWFNAAGAVCSDDPSFVDSQHEHVLAATYEDGWEWEGSTYYHLFVLAAYEVSIISPPPAVARRLEAMRDVAATFAGTALHDSPYGPLPHASAPILGDLVPLSSDPHPGLRQGGDYGSRAGDPHSSLRLDADHARRPPRDPHPGLCRDWAVGDTQRDVDHHRVYRDVGYAVINSGGVKAIVDFGPHGGSHGHRDKLSLYMYPWQPDPGQVPYGHQGWRDYYASTRAHPTFRIDELEQAECAGRLIDEHTFACDEAYDGVRAVRRVTPIDGGLLDELTVSCDRPRKVTLQLRPAVPLRVEAMTTRWLGEPTLVGRHSCDTESEFVVKPGPGPADDPQRTMRHVDWTVYDATDVTFRSEYRCLT